MRRPLFQVALREFFQDRQHLLFLAIRIRYTIPNTLLVNPQQVLLARGIRTNILYPQFRIHKLEQQSPNPEVGIFILQCFLGYLFPLIRRILHLPAKLNVNLINCTITYPNIPYGPQRLQNNLLNNRITQGMLPELA